MKISSFFLPAVLVLYAALYIATSKGEDCDTACEQFSKTQMELSQNRPYIYIVSRCTYRQGSDTLCVYVRDTAGIDWNLLADTVCQTAARNGLFHQKVILLKTGGTPPDTLVKKSCP